eukprot:2083060-Amphidinium_carterae.1
MELGTWSAKVQDCSDLLAGVALANYRRYGCPAKAKKAKLCPEFHLLVADVTRQRRLLGARSTTSMLVAADAHETLVGLNRWLLQKGCLRGAMNISDKHGA